MSSRPDCNQPSVRLKLAAVKEKTSITFATKTVSNFQIGIPSMSATIFRDLPELFYEFVQCADLLGFTVLLSSHFCALSVLWYARCLGGFLLGISFLNSMHLLNTVTLAKIYRYLSGDFFCFSLAYLNFILVFMPLSPYFNTKAHLFWLLAVYHSVIVLLKSRKN